MKIAPLPLLISAFSLAAVQFPPTPFAVLARVCYSRADRPYQNSAFEHSAIFNFQMSELPIHTSEDARVNCEYLALLALFNGDGRGAPISARRMADLFQCSPARAAKMPEFIYMNHVRQHGPPSFKSRGFDLKQELLKYLRNRARFGSTQATYLP